MRTVGALLLALCCAKALAAAPAPPEAVSLEALLVQQYGEAQRARAHRGIAQVMARWRAEDGDGKALEAFVRGNFAGTQPAIDALFARMDHNLMMILGHAQEVRREMTTPSDLDTGPIASWDGTFASWDPGAHVLDDLYANKLAFVVLLNFPLTSLEEREHGGAGWTRRQWAETLLAERFRKRVPAEVILARTAVDAEADRYIAGYNIWMHQLLDDRGQRLFPEGMRLLSHWNLRDEIKARYADGRKGLPQQRMIQRVMERIIAQEIPAAVIDNPRADWNPFTNTVTGAAADREPDTRYAEWLANFHVQQQIDRYSPDQPTAIARVFEGERQLSDVRVEAMLEQLLGSPEVARVAKLIQRRLGRRLEPFDVWYTGFRPNVQQGSKLDALVAARYPDVAAFQSDLPQILRRLGFAPGRADYVAQHIVVDPARGSGHAMGAQLVGANAHLRTRFGPGGMDYKGYNIAIHEMCHNVEQTFSLDDVEYFSLNGVPNTAFTEALAFTCQDRDLELLGLASPGPEQRALSALDTFWGAYEIGGVALVDLKAWRWMYAHPAATPAELREAVISIAREVWNRWYAPAFGVRDVTLLAVYSHMIDETLYLPDYPVGHMIAFQVEAQMNRAGDFGGEFERVARLGAIAPDLWMMKATGAPVGPEALIVAAQKALESL